jgi:hypothetical protein
MAPQTEIKRMPYSVDALPTDDRIWRVMWHGKVRRYNKTREGELDILLTPLKKGYKPSDIDFSNKLIDYLDSKSSIIVPVGIGQINLYRIGSLWQTQTCLGSLPYKTKQAYFTIDVKNLTYCQVNDRTFPYTSYSDPDNTRHWRCISKYDYFIDPSFNATWLAIIKDSFGAEYIIPTSEIARFYYMTSSKMAHAMTEGWQFLNSNDIWNSARSGIVDDDTYRIHLRKNFGIAEAPVIARMDACPIAKRQGNLIFHNLNQFGSGKNNDTAGELKCGFPFEGSTKLKFKGLPTKMGQTSRFLVYEILSCSGRFPFDRLTVDSDVPSHFENRGDPNRPIVPHIPQGDNKNSKLSKKTIRNVDTSFDNIAKRIEQDEDKFLDRNNKITEYLYRDQPQTRRDPNAKPAQDTDTFSTASPGYSSQEAGQLNVVSTSHFDKDTEEKTPSKSQNLPVKFAITIEAVNITCLILDSTYQMIGIGNTVEIEIQNSSITGCYYPQNENVRKRWELLNRYSNMQKVRRVLIFRILYKNNYYYLFEAERETMAMNKKQSGPSLLIISVNQQQPIDDYTMLSILETQVENNTTWLKSSQFPELKRYRVSHGCGSKETFAKAIVRKIRMGFV